MRGRKTVPMGLAQPVYTMKLDRTIKGISVGNSVLYQSVSLKLCIYVMLFSIAGSIIGQISFIPDTTKAALMSLMEITAGLDKISGLNIALKYKILMMLSFTAFGGMSSVLQTMSLWSGKNFHLKSYILYKLGIAAFTAITALLLIVIGIL